MGDLVPFVAGAQGVERREIGVISRVRKIQNPRRDVMPHTTQFQQRGFSEPPIGSVIKFDLRFPEGPTDTTYTYVAFHSPAHGGRWYTTGATCPPFGWTWAQLCGFVDRHQLVGMPLAWNGRENAL